MGTHDTWHYQPRIPTKDMIGRRFNRLTVIGLDTSERKDPSRMFVCQCDCGNITTVRYTRLVRGEIKSCGCLSKDNHYKIHGQSHTRLYRIWSKMLRRCGDENDKQFRYYGGRGITVCDEWRNDFVTFATWAHHNGYNDKLTLDRIDVHQGYTPDNCRWATYATQSRHRSDTKLYTYNGDTMVLTDFAAKYGFNAETLRQRVVDYGMSIDDAINTPLNKQIKRYEFHGKLYALSELARRYNLSYACVWRRLYKQHWDLERALTTPSRTLRREDGEHAS